jgi:hypothetical protein
MKDLTQLDSYRVRDRKVLQLYGSFGGAGEGMFSIPSPRTGAFLQCIASSGMGWDHPLGQSAEPLLELDRDVARPPNFLSSRRDGDAAPRPGRGPHQRPSELPASLAPERWARDTSPACGDGRVS